MTEVNFFTPPYCIFCKALAPTLKRFCNSRGVKVNVYKVGDNGIAMEIDGLGRELDVSGIPAFPAVVIDNMIFIGSDILIPIKKYIRRG